MIYWLENKSRDDINQIMEDRNEIAFRRIFPDLLHHNENKWGLISNGDLVGVYESKIKCFNAVKENNLVKTPNLVFPIEKLRPKHIRFAPYRRNSSAFKV